MSAAPTDAEVEAARRDLAAIDRAARTSFADRVERLARAMCEAGGGDPDLSIIERYPGESRQEGVVLITSGFELRRPHWMFYRQRAAAWIVENTSAWEGDR